LTETEKSLKEKKKVAFFAFDDLLIFFCQMNFFFAFFHLSLSSFENFDTYQKRKSTQARKNNFGAKK
jgi:hypothetical protein